MKIDPFEGEPDKRRLLGALRGEPTDRVPHFEILIEDRHVATLLGRPAGNTLGVGGDPAKGSAAAAGARPMLPRDYIELCRIIGQDAIALEAFWTPIKQRQPDGTVGLLNDRSFKGRADLARVIWPDESDIEERLQYVREYVAAVSGTDIGVLFTGAAIWETLSELVIGLQDCLVLVLEDCELIEELLSRSADYFTKLVQQSIDAGIDAILLADDFAYNKGLFVEPRLFERLWRPAVDRIMAPARQAGVPVLFHSDGKIDDAIEMLLEMGVQAITPMDPSSVDYRDYKRRYGHRLTLVGNIDVGWPLSTGTPADVQRDVREHLEVLKPGGRWIAGSSHSILNSIPHENFIAMINEFHKGGRYS